MKVRGLSTVGILGAAGLLLYALGPAGTTEGSTEENPKPVQVMNDAGAPVPTTIVGGTAVSGTVAASQSGPWSVGASQNGPWSVAVSNLPAVQPVEFAAPQLESGRVSYVIETFADEAHLLVPAGVVLTDLVGEQRNFGDFQCAIDIFVGPATAENRLLRTAPTTHQVFELHLNTGYRGPLTIKIVPTGLEEGRCSGEFFWTGYRLP